jgi:hypothetical protein
MLQLGLLRLVLYLGRFTLAKFFFKVSNSDSETDSTVLTLANTNISIWVALPKGSLGTYLMRSIVLSFQALLVSLPYAILLGIGQGKLTEGESSTQLTSLFSKKKGE